MAPGVAEVGDHLQFPAERANVIAEGAEFGHGAAEALRMSAANHLEAAIVVDSARDPVASCRFDQFIAEADIRVEPVHHPRRVLPGMLTGYRDYGEGSGHRASLNFGDCFAYALAKETGEPLLFKGDDFSSTDIASALDGR